MTPEKLRWAKIESAEKNTRALIRRKFSASRMSTTKWRHVAYAMSGLKLNVRVKFVDVESVLENDGWGFWHVTGDWFDTRWGPVSSTSIEWMEIDPTERVHLGSLIDPRIVNHSEQVARLLHEGSVPFEMLGVALHITGYVI